MRMDLQPLKVHLLLAVCADLLSILRKANLRTQRSTLRILDVDTIVEACQAEITQYVQPGGTMDAAFLLMGN